MYVICFVVLEQMRRENGGCVVRFCRCLVYCVCFVSCFFVVGCFWVFVYMLRVKVVVLKLDLNLIFLFQWLEWRIFLSVLNICINCMQVNCLSMVVVFILKIMLFSFLKVVIIWWFELVMLFGSVVFLSIESQFVKVSL